MAKVLKPLKRKKNQSKSPPGVVIKKKRRGHFLISDDKIPDQEEEERLEKFLFDEAPNLDDNEKLEETEFSLDEDIGEETQTAKCDPVWHDEDDEVKVEKAPQRNRINVGMKVKSDDPYYDLLKKKFEAVVGTPSWAKLRSQKERNEESDSEDEEDSQLIRHCGKMINTKSNSLPKGKIEFKELTDLNKDSRYAEGKNIEAVEFHKSSSVALVAGASSIASIFHVDGRENAKLQSVKFERFPIRCAHFTLDGEQFIVGSQFNSHFYCYDMVSGKTLHVPVHHALGQTNMKKFIMSPDGKFIAVCGRYGSIHILASKSKEFICSLQMNGNVEAITFNSDGSTMYSHGDSGEVYVWDMTSRQCVRRFYDDGSIKGTSITVSPNDQLLATGSSSGAVNVYKLPITSNSPAPIKTILNLVTAVTNLCFNASSEILAISSGDKSNAVKFVHFPSLTVFSNFPASNTFFHVPFTMDFSPSSGYFAFGNNRSKVKLFRLNHFKNY